MSGFGGTQDTVIKFLVPGAGTAGRWPPAASGQLSGAGPFPAGLVAVMGTAALESGVPFLPPQEAQTPVPLSSVLTLPPGGRMEDGTQGLMAPVPGILTGLPAPLPGLRNPKVIQNSRKPGQGDPSRLPDQWSCAPLPDPFFPASLAALGGHRPGSKQWHTRERLWGEGEEEHLGELLLLHRRDRCGRRVFFGHRSSSFMPECRRDVQGCSSHPVATWHQVHTEDGGQRDGKSMVFAGLTKLLCPGSLINSSYSSVV